MPIFPCNTSKCLKRMIAIYYVNTAIIPTNGNNCCIKSTVGITVVH